jgi:Helix-turn-helix domain
MSSEQNRQPAPRPRRRRAAATGQPPAGEIPGGAVGAGPSAAEGPSGEPKLLTDPIVMRALAHPVRTALFGLLSAVDTLTATQASDILGESPANCAFHLRTLAKYGFVQEAGGGRGRERPWRAANQNIAITATHEDRKAAMAGDALSRLWLDQWIERARAVFGSAATLPGWEHTKGWSRNVAFLTAEETRDLTRQIQELIMQYEPRKSDPSLRPPGALPVEWSVFEAPMAELADLAAEQARAAAVGAAEPGSDPPAGRGGRD